MNRQTPQPVFEFCTLTFRSPGLNPPNTPRPAGWITLLSTLASAPGCAGIYHGPKIEDPQSWVLVIHWSSRADFDAFVGSAAYIPWLREYRSLVESESTHQVCLGPNPLRALGAPCTEVVTAFGVEPQFIENCRGFAEKVDGGRVDGYHGYGCGEVLAEIAKGDEEKAPAAMLIIGWDSKEAHVAAKSRPGPIAENIHEIRTGRKDVALYHVNLEKFKSE